MEFEKTWQSVTVPQMAELLRTRLDGIRPGFWGKMREDFTSQDKRFQREQKNPKPGVQKKSFGIPGIASSMVYFLTTVVALEEKSHGREPSLKELMDTYHLDGIVNNSASSEDGFWYYYYLNYIVERRNLNLDLSNLKKSDQNKTAATLCYQDQIFPLVTELVKEGPGELGLNALLEVLVVKNPLIKNQKNLGEPLKNLRVFLDSKWTFWVQADLPKQDVPSDCIRYQDAPSEFLNFTPFDFYNAQGADSKPNPKPAEPAAPQDGLPGNPEKNSAELWRQIEGTFSENAVKRLNDGVLQMIFTGAPGTGKTYFAKLIARYLGELQPWLNPPRAYTLVQFHPSYDYTDFVEGLRPVQLSGRGGRMAFVKLDGAFKAFCRSVLLYGNPKELYFFLIDEINRAELPKVLGELMYCLEEDKRGKDNRVQTQYQNLPAYELETGTGEPRRIQDDVFSEGFYIPENVRILGTMNDIDRSVESMDFALRRRFEWRTAEVNEASLESALKKMGLPAPETLAARTMALNRELLVQGARYGLNKHYFIAQGQFANLFFPPDRSLEELLTYVWDSRIEPLLQEYLRGEAEQNVTNLLESCRGAFFSLDR